MAHLKCSDGRRVVVLQSGEQIHRNGDGSRCTADISIGGKPIEWRSTKSGFMWFRQDKKGAVQ